MAENKIFESIMNGLSESLAYAKGDTSKARKMSVTVAEFVNNNLYYVGIGSTEVEIQ